MTNKTQTAIFGAGCFWGVEDAFMSVEGVLKTEVGYCGGTTENPTYEEVCTDKTGHAEVVKIEFDEETVSYDELLDIFWEIHDPTTLNRQGPDVGTQYRSVIFYMNEKQKELALLSKENLEQSPKFKGKIKTQIVPSKKFYLAEDYHQQYFKNNNIKTCHI